MIRFPIYSYSVISFFKKKLHILIKTKEPNWVIVSALLIFYLQGLSNVGNHSFMQVLLAYVLMWYIPSGRILKYENNVCSFGFSLQIKKSYLSFYHHTHLFSLAQ